MSVWLGGTKNGSSWTWTDGNPFSFISQPSSGNCLAISPSQTTSNWYSRNCSTNLPYLREIPAEVETFSSCPPKPTINPTNPCKQGYSFFPKWNYCYKYVNEGLDF
uniref:C-type lectin domain-containing protein n=1 Tax=Acrobeloides nanus TaxID=290746 RepID=A0A914CHR9_9BILA